MSLQCHHMMLYVDMITRVHDLTLPTHDAINGVRAAGSLYVITSFQHHLMMSRDDVIIWLHEFSCHWTVASMLNGLTPDFSVPGAGNAFVLTNISAQPHCVQLLQYILLVEHMLRLDHFSQRTQAAKKKILYGTKWSPNFGQYCA